ncbi:DNA-binding anti-repressor SinI [Bacillus megaterium]|nr:DNA-binding anti-repressor SinI [Priestia megaterium]NEW04373.1 DNA-binding anti-repressor SinI [Priestia megaterium]
MDSKGQLVAQELNQEWVKLIKEAKKLGLTIEEIKKFLESK